MKWRFAGLFALVALLLGSCAPSVMQPSVPPAVAPANVQDSAGGGLKFLGESLWFAAGTLEAWDVQVKISGDNLRVNAPDFCRVDRADILCTVAKIPAGKNFVLPMTGSNISAVAVYKRPNGLSFSSQARR
ncbi:MAG: hypothetical protein Q4C89_12250 [Deinococcus sp.]|uniref:hypothetical protein n=1 Tax=Deinococcus sp. TaxID=47478 RepID=UPI0026DDB66A|nr:hypothetical protein [Deinococcus sp.]MDO4246787.1 hypothetical protein [Deinococcus sp.]